MRRGRGPAIAAAVALFVLALIGGTYWYTVEPAPAVKVRWREGIGADRQAELERRFLLFDPVAPEGRSATYTLLDTSAANIEAIVEAPEVEDTYDIERQRYTVQPAAPYGTRWMWLAHRVPLLRTPGVVETIVAACAVVLIGAGLAALRKRRVPARAASDAPS